MGALHGYGSLMIISMKTMKYVFFILLFQNILVYTFLKNTYYIHLLYTLRERREGERERGIEGEREGGFIQYFSFLITLHICIYRSIVVTFFRKKT